MLNIWINLVSSSLPTKDIEKRLFLCFHFDYHPLGTPACGISSTRLYLFCSASSNIPSQEKCILFKILHWSWVPCLSKGNWWQPFLVFCLVFSLWRWMSSLEWHAALHVTGVCWCIICVMLQIIIAVISKDGVENCVEGNMRLEGFF